MRLIIIMEQQQAPLTVVGDIMLKWGSFSFSRVSWFAKICCAGECVRLYVVSCLLPDLKHDWLSPVQSCHLDTPSPWPRSTLLLINRCCYAKLKKKTSAQNKKEKNIDRWESPTFQVEISWLKMRTTSFPLSVNCSFSPLTARTHMQRLIQCSSPCLFSHGQTRVCASSLLLCTGFISGSLRGIDKNLFTNQFSTQNIPSVITNMHGSHTLILYHLCNFCKIITISSKPDTEMMFPETVFIPLIPTWCELSVTLTCAVTVRAVLSPSTYNLFWLSAYTESCFGAAVLTYSAWRVKSQQYIQC